MDPTTFATTYFSSAYARHALLTGSARNTSSPAITHHRLNPRAPPFLPGALAHPPIPIASSPPPATFGLSGVPVGAWTGAQGGPPPGWYPSAARVPVGAPGLKGLRPVGRTVACVGLRSRWGGEGDWSGGGFGNGNGGYGFPGGEFGNGGERGRLGYAYGGGDGSGNGYGYGYGYGYGNTIENGSGYGYGYGYGYGNTIENGSGYGCAQGVYPGAGGAGMGDGHGHVGGRGGRGGKKGKGKGKGKGKAKGKKRGGKGQEPAGAE